jgi:hypothetical protein
VRIEIRVLPVQRVLVFVLAIGVGRYKKRHLHKTCGQQEEKGRETRTDTDGTFSQSDCYCCAKGDTRGGTSTVLY